MANHLNLSLLAQLQEKSRVKKDFSFPNPPFHTLFWHNYPVSGRTLPVYLNLLNQLTVPFFTASFSPGLLPLHPTKAELTYSLFGTKDQGRTRLSVIRSALPEKDNTFLKVNRRVHPVCIYLQLFISCLK
ncbi:MAG: hypothetical protein D8M58_22295 [Calditrichaeota bacterium]|nr:MAG: hypothetical protein DWQ03_08465 [Calditrichota bacterium]MBL1208145.1 hypothetical protein [Calditrichota bacterium]